MPSKRQQINVRLGEDAKDRLDRLMVRMSARMHRECSQADVIAAALGWAELHWEAVEISILSRPPAARPKKPKRP